MDSSLETIYYGCVFLSNGFMVMDCDFSNYNQACSFGTSHENMDVNVNVWHVRLGHIRQVICPENRAGTYWRVGPNMGVERERNQEKMKKRRRHSK